MIGDALEAPRGSRFHRGGGDGGMERTELTACDGTFRNIIDMESPQAHYFCSTSAKKIRFGVMGSSLFSTMQNRI